MRHQKAGRALGVKPAHRRAMMRNLVTSLVEKERIRTTLARAKELRRPLAKMITLGKQGDLNARRQALAFVESKEAMSKLFGELAERYADRQGGYVRIVRMAPRRGDGAEMALVLLVDGPDDPLAGETKSRRQRTGGRRRKAAVEEVAEGVKSSGRKARTRKSTKVEDEAPAAEASAEPAAEEAAAEPAAEETAAEAGELEQDEK